MRQEIDKIEIKEPPIEELNKKRSCVKHACFTSFIFFVFLFIVSLTILKFTAGPRSRELKDLPDVFIKQIPLYDIDSLESITYTPGQEKSKKAERIAYIPKLVLSPFVIYFDKEYKFIPIEDIKNKEDLAKLTKWDKFKRFLFKPIMDHKDTYIIEWKNLPAKQSFIFDYYKNELRKKDFQIKNEIQRDNIKSFIFSQKEAEIEGIFYSDDDATTNFTDFVSISVDL
ncbi:MAG: hypothetical protein WC414_03540 [Patescibacteria group bacterium]